MRLLRYGLATGVLLAASAGVSLAQPPGDPFLESIQRTQPPAAPVTAPSPVPVIPPSSEKGDLDSYLAQIDNLRKEQAALQAGAQTEDEKKRIELLQKQVETLEKMVRLLADQLKKQPAAGPGMDQLQIQAARLEARSVQAARRDQELASSIDDLREHIDAEQRYGPRLPAALKELFLLSGTNETPLSIYGAQSFGYSKIIGDSTTAA